ncbi:hypothetical protein GCM10011494_12350 [Novosphingobium endophyticum]|uniref:Filamentous hemagglutinin N-terminal domain-containing protein n=1 Tax=Novosphingobium endophyticum TaxID=1955250 RepID=A0A916TQW4_9SPHN|nr:hypothetical protein [Novosphingobium endophyticum]GGB95396.1 hypothetical protein GCM10011494_12350 [Novosphingobium endophyticum]
MTKTPIPARGRKAALSGASLSALMLAVAATQPAAAQSFQGTGNVTTGSASIIDGAGTTDVFVLTNEVVIDWTTLDSSGTGNVVFQPSGTTATFAESSSVGTDYTVLNRIVPVDVNGAATNATIQFDGTVNSTLFGATGGNIWFYSPNGVILGSTARFNVGGLVLTTNPIDTTGGLYGSSGEIRFNGAAGSLAPVTIQSGAQINAVLNPQVPGNPAYVALVAPRIEQAGTVRSDGSIAYVAAEVADITINAGLFDINVTTGTTDGNGVVHTGTTGGSASTGAADVKTIYMVAMGKNDGLTMLLNGGIGYDAAALATDDGSAVVLSAGHGIGFDAGDPLTATASIAIGDAQFTSLTTATATDTITVAPTSTTSFERFATLDAINRVELNAVSGAQIVANDTAGVPADLPFGTGYSLDVSAGYAEQGGTIAITVDGGALSLAGHLRLRAIGDGSATAALSPDGIGGTIAINLLGGSIDANELQIDASGFGRSNSVGTGGVGTGGSISIASAGDLAIAGLTATAVGTGGDGDVGGDGNGGSIQLTASNNGTIVMPFANLDASGNGGFGLNQGGNGTGGQIDTAVGTGGTIGSSTSYSASTGGFGGSSDALGGDGTGGGNTLTDDGGILDFTNVSISSIGSGASSDGDAGDGFGGTAHVLLRGNAQNWDSLYVDASAFGGESFGGGASGSATADLANGARLDVEGVDLGIANFLELHADAWVAVNGDAGSFGRAGNAVVDVGTGGSLTAGGDVFITANASFNIEGLGSDPDFTPDMFGGNAALAMDNGSVAVPSLSVEAFAVSMGALVDAGSATGGTAQVAVGNNSSLIVDSALGVSVPSVPGLNIVASATGAYETQIGPDFRTVVDGLASPAQGGSASLLIDSGTIDVAEAMVVKAQGIGGPSDTIGGADSLGNGTGGTALVAVSGGTMTLGATLDVLADGIGGTIKGGATGGDGVGGLAAIDASGGALFVNGAGLTISANGESTGVDPAESGSSGNATGGEARLLGGGGDVTVAGTTLVRARGLAGAAGVGGVAGDGTGGLALLISENGGTIALNDAVSVLADGLGGAGTASGALGGNGFGGSASAGLSGTGGMTITGNLLLDVSATGGDNSVDSLVQGLASGGSGGLELAGGTLQVIGDVTLDADATGGANPVGTAPPTTAGFLKIGSDTADPSGTLTVTGSLDVSAVGDAAPTGGEGLSLRTANAALSVDGDTTIAVTGNAVFDIVGSGSLDTGGALAVTSTAGQVTGTGLLSSGGNMLISGATGIDLGSLDSGGTTGLFAANGAVAIADLLSTGPVTVSGLSVSIGSSGGLTFADADATSGDLTIDVSDGLTVATVDATGAVTLASTSGSVTMNDAVSGAGITATAGQDIAVNGGLASSGGATLDAGGSVAVNGDTIAAGLLDITAGQTITVDALASGSQIAATSQDVAIGSAGQIGQRGTTATIGFTNSNGGNVSYVGGTATTGGYSLDGGELQQVFADQEIAFAVQPNTGAGEVELGNLSLSFGTGQAIGSGGTLSLTTGGRISVNGDVALTTSDPLDTLDLAAASVEVVTDAGSIAMSDASGNRLGRLRVNADRFVAATSDAIAQLDPAMSMDEVNALMDGPGTGPAQGSLLAGSIEANVVEGIYIQNIGASTEYADRRGFTADSLAITTGAADTRIVINGMTVDASGNAVTGLDTVSTIFINGAVAAGGGSFDALSTVNGCIIGLRCDLPQTGHGPDDLVRTKADIESPVSPGNIGGGLLSAPVIQIDTQLLELERDPTLPLVDEPVTGVGNEDLWDGGCSPGEEDCAEGQTK